MTNTFAPVVKGITVRLLLALALIFSMHVHQLMFQMHFAVLISQVMSTSSHLQNFDFPMVTVANFGRRCTDSGVHLDHGGSI